MPAAHLQVVAQPPAALPAAERLLLDIPATNLYVGQAVSARVLLPAAPGGMLQLLAQVQITGDGFVVDQSGVRQRVETLAQPPGGQRGPTRICETSLTPITAGRLSAFAQGYTAGFNSAGPLVVQGPIVLPGGPPRYTLLDSDPVEFEVKPVPRRGELPGFTGAVGRYTIEAPTLATNGLRVGDTVKLTVKVRGEGNLARLVPPPAPRIRDWQVFAPRPTPRRPRSSKPRAPSVLVTP